MLRWPFFGPPKFASAAQNVRVIQICRHCGALLYDTGRLCPFCGVRLSKLAQNEGSGAPDPERSNENELEPSPISASVNDSAESPAPEPEWRQEVARRLDAYRARRRQYDADYENPQTPLPFAADIKTVAATEEPPAQRITSWKIRPRRNERVEISLSQPELDFDTARDYRAHPQTSLVTVASLEERRWAALMDAFFLCLTYAGFLGLFHSLGGTLAFAKVDAAVYVATFFLLYIQYFGLFTTFAGATPGMQLRGLYVVRLDGTLPDTRQLLWRSFGYILSGGTLMLGFLWSLWDEDHFTWQDRISQTFLTATTPLNDEQSIGLIGRQTLPHH